jgi:hypothetical protein
MSALPPKADIELNSSSRAAYDPKRTFWINQNGQI